MTKKELIKALEGSNEDLNEDLVVICKDTDGGWNNIERVEVDSCAIAIVFGGGSAFSDEDNNPHSFSLRRSHLDFFKKNINKKRKQAKQAKKKTILQSTLSIIFGLLTGVIIAIAMSGMLFSLGSIVHWIGTM